MSLAGIPSKYVKSSGHEMAPHMRKIRDRFLGNDAKTSIESGFSSSFGFNQSGNSKELLNSTSQDLFNHTPKINACEGQVPNVEYHKYISQNLLFGKKGRTVRKFTFGGDKNELNTEEKSPLKSTEVQDQNDMSEIKSARKK
ncbi:uncharacterized protein TNCT_483681 [Trichonephila clavata]|uniref:Uncharacterized protein n=1 Tax=Trichonephila clavata TaxID=2740835 RepID=A0A8X6L4G6_TRICU|nr:uncharacterized protein TNCT_483681 [Trichonephila clavata]